MLNRVVLMGRLVADPELKQTQNGVSVTSFRIAVDRNYVRQGEDRKADFFDIVAWRKTAEFIANNFGKGSLIAVDGQLQTRQYQAQDGTNRNVVEVVVARIDRIHLDKDGVEVHVNKDVDTQRSKRRQEEHKYQLVPELKILEVILNLLHLCPYRLQAALPPECLP